MQLTRFIAATLIGVLTILGACASPASTPPPTPAPTTPAPTTPAPTTPAPTTPAPTTPAPTTPAPTTPAPTTPAPTTPAPTTPATPTGPANFVLSNLAVTPARVEVEDVATVSVVVKNTGGQSGTYTVVMSFAGEGKPAVTTSKGVTLAAGASQTVIFPISSKDLGTFTITIGDLTTKLSVEIF